MGSLNPEPKHSRYLFQPRMFFSTILLISHMISRILAQKVGFETGDFDISIFKIRCSSHKQSCIGEMQNLPPLFTNLSVTVHVPFSTSQKMTPTPWNKTYIIHHFGSQK